MGGGHLDEKRKDITSNDSGSLYRSYINITDKSLYKSPNKKDLIHGQILSTHMLWLYKLYEMFKKNVYHIIMSFMKQKVA